MPDLSLGWIGIGKLAVSDETASVLFQSYSGGAHCCWSLMAAVPVDGRFQAVDVGGWDGTGLEVFPRDVDGDGHVDFVWNDGAFNYAFSSYAGSWPPPQIVNLLHGQVVDVSARPGFDPLFEAFSRKARVACAEEDIGPERNGACAGYVAAEARLGRLEAALEFADAMADNGPDATLPGGCRTGGSAYACPDDQKIRFEDFSSAIRWFVRDRGYVP